MILYVISVDDRRCSDFAERNAGLHHFKKIGVDGRKLPAADYFRNAVAGRKVPMTPSELGCSLSHIKALQDFLQTREEFACIFEDDITFKGPDLLWIESQLTKLANGPIVIHLGGQNGLPGRWKIRGRVVSTAATPIWEVSLLSLRWLWRTCGYIVNRSMAESMISTQLQHVGLADSWSSHVKSANASAFYCDAVDHPIDLASSGIEKERKDVIRGSVLHKYSQKVVGAAIFIGLGIAGRKRIHEGE